jgi:hypothetical protein
MVIDSPFKTVANHADQVYRFFRFHHFLFGSCRCSDNRQSGCGSGYDILASANHITFAGWFFEQGEGNKCLIVRTNAEGLLVESKTIGIGNTPPLTVFPNPATSDIFVDLPPNTSWEHTVAEIYSTDGRLLLWQTGDTTGNGIVVSGLTPGLYHLNIRSLENGQILGTAPFVKK